MWSDEVMHGFVVVRATGQGEAAIALEMREGAPPTSARSTLYRDPGSQSDYTRTWAHLRCPTYWKTRSRSHQEPAQGPSPCARPSPSATRDAAVITRARAHIAVPRYVGSQSQRAYWNSPVGSRRLALAGAAVLEAIPGVTVSMVTGDRELSSTRTVAHRERGWPARNSEPTGNTVNSNTEPV